MEIIEEKRNAGMKVLHINSYYSGSKFYKNLYNQQVNTGLGICYDNNCTGFLGLKNYFRTE